MTAVTAENIRKIAQLAQLELARDDVSAYQQHLTNVLEFITPICQINTKNIKPMSHVWDFALHLRADQVTEKNQRELLQSDAPSVEAGLYLVPKVIEICEIEN